MHLRGTSGRAKYRWRPVFLGVLQCITLFLFWLALSGHYHIMYLIFGAASAGLITVLNAKFIGTETQHEKECNSKLVAPLILWHLVTYIPWLSLNIVIANIQVAYVILHPRMPINPALLRFEPGFKQGVSEVTLANSITLTPGTVTIELKDDKYVVHTLAPASARSLVTGQIQKKVGAAFGEEVETPSVQWLHSIEEVE